MRHFQRASLNERAAAWKAARRGWRPNGLEPRDSRGQLEQQREELPVSEPQQQHAGQQEQQPGLPSRPGPSSTAPSENAATDPAAILSCGEGEHAGKQRESAARCE